MANNVVVLSSEPGIQRDGTKYDSKNYIDGQWVRFYRNRPRKIGGYQIIELGKGPTITSIIRTLYNYDNPSHPNSCDTYIGRADSVSYENFLLKPNLGQGGGEIDRTPTNYPTYYNTNNLWDFDVFTYTNPEDSSTVNYIVAHVAPNANDVSNTIPGPIYYGSTVPPDENTPLKQVLDSSDAPILVSGGIVFAAPILVAYDNNGLIRWSDPGKITGWPLDNFQNIANTKIIKMVVSRGSASPQLLAWTLDSIISLSYTTIIDPPSTTWAVVPIDSTITVMSPGSIVGYANQFFWVGLNQFYFFNGIVNTLPNTMNADFFFGDPVYGINLKYRSNVFGQIIHPNIGVTELWWYYTSNSSPNGQNDQAIVYIVEAQKWFNTAINRSAGVPAGVFPLPIMSDNRKLNGTDEVYALWMHEYGYDKITSLPPETTNKEAIDSYFESHIYDFFEGNPAVNRLMRNRRIEPDLEMNGNMTVTVHNRFFPSDTITNGQLKISGPYTFDLNTQKIDAVTSQGRLVSFRFESNEIGGTYQMGKTLLNYNIGDSRPTGAGSSGTGS